MTEGWNLISAGPSRKYLRSGHLLHGPVVTVNRAIDVIDNGIRVDFAAFADGPSKCWTALNLERYLHIQQHIQIWTPLFLTTQKVIIRRPPVVKKFVPNPAFLKVAAKVLPATAQKALAELCLKYLTHPGECFEVEAPGPTILHFWDRILPASTGIRELPHGTVHDVNDQEKGRVAFTAICALERIFMFRPERVRILCADMAGPWIEGKTEAECHEHEQEKAKKTGTPLDRWRHEKYAMNVCIEAAKKEFGVEVDWLRPEPEPIPCPS